ncbi:MAG TPA: PadR family transcriptional regulator [Steroidobacteraceae bacterium]|jgi:DNA-binding PadR family transcriptional regulator|nr:PadR family transcriptional regulator [Steroidobacteraceae bacterium]
MRFFHHPDHGHGAVHHHSIRHGGHGGGFFGFGHHFGEGFGPHGAGRGGFGPGRKLGSADLQLLLLALLAEKPSHGYELIKAIEERSNGYYSPSPGMVYPALTYLEEIGYASVAPEGARKLYSATETGHKHLADNRAALETLLMQLQQIGQRMQKFRRALQPEAVAGDAADASAPELQVARFDLKLALAAKADAPRDEQLRIAAIVRQAAADIRGQ